MGSNVSSNETNNSLLNRSKTDGSITPSTTETKSKTTSLDAKNESEPSHVFIKDQFKLEFLDCDCCCDTTKKISNCDFQGIHILNDLYDMVSKYKFSYATTQFLLFFF